MTTDEAPGVTFRVVGTRTVYAGRSSVRLDLLEDATGERFEREIVEHDDAVALVAIDADDMVVMVRQYRHALGDELLEIPAGTLDVPGEEPEAAAHRELAEEAGLAAARLEPLGAIWNSSGWSEERTRLYLATGLGAVPAPEGYRARAEEAVMRVVRIPLSEAVARARDGRLTDAKSVVGILRAAARLEGGDRRSLA